MKNPNGPSIEKVDDWHDAQRDEVIAEGDYRYYQPKSANPDEERLRILIMQLREFHTTAETAQWSAVEDSGQMNNKHRALEAFNVAAWNNLPWILDVAEHLQKWVKLLGNVAESAQKERNDLRDAATYAYNALVDAMETLIVCDHISMIRHPHLVDKLHQAVNGLKRTIHVCEPPQPPASREDGV